MPIKSSTYVGISTKKIVPVPAVPEPNSPEGVIPEFPFRGDFFAGINLYLRGLLAISHKSINISISNVKSAINELESTGILVF